MRRAIRGQPVIESNIFNALELVDGREVGALPGNPAWLNAAFRARPGSSQFGLGGPGIYAMFFERALVHLGSYAGTNQTPYGGSVLSERWLSLLGTVTMRGRKASIGDDAREFVGRSREGAPLGDLAKALKNPAAPLRRNQGMQLPCRKMIWAASNWDRLSRPIGEIMAGIDFVYVRISPEARITAIQSVSPKLPDDRPGMMEWLKAAEIRIMEHFMPPLNAESRPAAADVLHPGPEQVRGLIEQHMHDALGSHACVAPLAARDRLDGAADRSPAARAVFLTGLPQMAASFIRDVEKVLPSRDRLTLYYTHDGKELRIGEPWSEKRKRPLMFLTWRNKGNFSQSFKVRTRAPLGAVVAAGFEPRNSSDFRMKVEFACDPAQHTAHDIDYLCEKILADM